jgi:RNase H-fold protein (predicted Holliday junction resolvase)
MASALDWQAHCGSSTILSLDIHKDRIGMAVAYHPSHGRHVSTLDSLPIAAHQRGKIDRSTLHKLRTVVETNKVCGVVVSWPLQPETGKMGAACGRVLHTLEDVLRKQHEEQQECSSSSDDDCSSSSTAPIITPNRPLCFWNHCHLQKESEDEWGRCASYASTRETAYFSGDRVHLASKEQYYQDENVRAAQVWNDFSRVHWPALHEQESLSSGNGRVEVVAASRCFVSTEDDYSWSDEDNSYHKSSSCV